MAKWQFSFEVTKAQPEKTIEKQDTQVQNEKHADSTSNLTASIAQGILLAQKTQLAEELIQKQKTHDEWARSIGLKNFDDKHILIRPLYYFFNSAYVLIHMLWIPEDKIKNSNCLSTLIKTSIALIFSFVQIILIFVPFFVLEYYFPQWSMGTPVLHDMLTSPTIKTISAWTNFICSVYVCLATIGLLRVAKIELANIKNKGELYALFAAIITAIALFI